jgi:hypothetical protein
MSTLPPIQAELAEPPQPRLSIAHLMLWMLSSAVFLALARFLPRGVPEEMRTLLLFYQGAQAMINGAAVATVPIWITRLVRGGPPFPTAPGHYLALLGAGSCVTQVVGNVVIQGLREIGVDDYGYYLIISMLLAALAGLMGLVCVIFCSRPPRWMLVFVVIVLCKGLVVIAALATLASHRSGFVSARSMPQWAYWISTIAVSVAIVTASAIDLARRVRRDWLHYVGVGAYLAQAVTYWVFLVAMRLVRS